MSSCDASVNSSHHLCCWPEQIQNHSTDFIFRGQLHSSDFVVCFQYKRACLQVGVASRFQVDESACCTGLSNCCYVRHSINSSINVSEICGKVVPSCQLQLVRSRSCILNSLEQYRQCNAGLRARIEAIQPNEDEDGLAEPAEVQEFMQEMGEPDSRSRFCSCLSHMLLFSVS